MSCVGVYVLISYFVRSEIGMKLAIPAMVLEIALGYGLAKSPLGGNVTHGPTYMLGEVGVVALIVGASQHLVSTTNTKILRRATLIALLGVSFSILFIGGIQLAFGSSLPSAMVLGLALAPTSAGVGSRVLALTGTSHSREGQMFFLTAIIDDTLGLLGLAIVELFAISGGSKALHGLEIEIGVAVVSLLGHLVLIKVVHPSNHGEWLGTILWIVIAGIAVLATLFGASPIVVAFMLAIGTSKVLKNAPKASRFVDNLGVWLVPLFFVALGAISAGFRFPGISIILVSVLIMIGASAAKVLAARIGYGSNGFLSLGVMLVPRAEITFVIALVAQSIGILDGAELFTIALTAVVLSTVASLILPKLSKEIEV